jgi:hypothetical protein
MHFVKQQRWVGERPDRQFMWQTVAVEDAMGTVGVCRCPECDKPVRLHKASKDGNNPAHAEHMEGNTTCSLSYHFELNR